MTHRVVLATAIVLSVSCRASHSFYDPPYITPVGPAAGQVVSVNIRGGVCDAIVSINDYPQVTRDGNAIRVLFWSVHNDDPVFCNYPVGTGVFALGTFAAGFYTLQVDRFDHLLLSGEPAAETLGVIPFTVSGDASPPASAPVLNPVGSSLLLFMLVALAARWLRSTRIKL